MRKIAVLLVIMGVITNAITLKIEGGAPAIEKVIKPIQEAFEKETGITLKAKAVGPKVALLDLQSGEVEVAIGPGAADWLKFMEKEGVPVEDPKSINMIKVGEDKIVVAINTQNSVAAISEAQLKGIFSGKIKNWKELGGSDAPIQIYTGQAIMPMVTVFYGKILGAEKPIATDTSVYSAGDVRSSVAKDINGIGILSVKLINDSVKQPEMQAVPLVFTLAINQNPNKATQALVDYLTPKK